MLYTDVNMIEDGFKISYERIYSLIKSIYYTTKMFAGDFEQEYTTADDWGNYCTGLENQKGSIFLIAKNNSKLIGYIIIKPRSQNNLRHTADLNMGVLEEVRGTGIGYKLLDTALACLIEKGIIEILYLMVREDNFSAVKLYENAGFEKLVILEKDTKIGSEYYNGILMRKFI